MSKVSNVMMWLAVAALLLMVPVAQAQDMTPLVEVNDQAVEDSMVTIARVVTDGPGWIVIHADDNGAPGEVVGYEAVTDGENLDVMVEIDTDLATETLYAMLHSDLGVEGTYEFPGDDTPVQVDGETVVEAFTVTGLDADDDMAEAVVPSVEVNDQEIVDGAVTVARVVSDGPGWIVIHADDNGSPGEVIGYAAVEDGENLDVAVDVDLNMVTDTLYAMLHSDLGTAGTYEFPGDDAPVQYEGNVVMDPFSVSMLAQGTPEATAEPTAEADQPETLPQTGGSTTPWLPLTLVLLGGAVVLGTALIMRTQAEGTDIRKD